MLPNRPWSVFLSLSLNRLQRKIQIARDGLLSYLPVRDGALADAEQFGELPLAELERGAAGAEVVGSHDLLYVMPCRRFPRSSLIAFR